MDTPVCARPTSLSPSFWALIAILFLSSCDSVLNIGDVAQIRFVNATNVNIDRLTLVTYSLNEVGSPVQLEYSDIGITETSDYRQVAGEGKRFAANLLLSTGGTAYIADLRSLKLESDKYTFRLSSTPYKKLLGGIRGTVSTDSDKTNIRVHNQAKVDFDRVFISFTRISDTTATVSSSVTFRSILRGKTTTFKTVDFASPYANAMVVTRGDTLQWISTDVIGERTLPNGQYTYSFDIANDLRFSAELLD